VFISCFYWLFPHLSSVWLCCGAGQMPRTKSRYSYSVTNSRCSAARWRGQLAVSADRVFLAALAPMLPRDRWGGVFVRPETVRRWHRSLIARRWTYPNRPPGRPATDAGVGARILRLARENPDWGYRRIQGELAGLGARIAASTVWSIIQQAGIDPAPLRSSETWREFLRTQTSGIVACDFFTVDTVTRRPLFLVREPVDIRSQKRTRGSGRRASNLGYDLPDGSQRHRRRQPPRPRRLCGAAG
jgi:hypothetical protein